MKRVLVAEDDAALRQMLITLLRQHGIEAVPAFDGQDAIDQLRESAFDLAIVDLMMPRLDGYTVVRYLEQHLPSTPAIVVSAVRGAELDELARSRSVDAVVHKPFEIEELTAKIRASLKQ